MNKRSGYLGLIVGFAALAASASSVDAWTAPTTTPPTGNVSTPLNTSGTTQTKVGVLNVYGLRSYVDGIFDGNVGIGTTITDGKLRIDKNTTVLTTETDYALKITDGTADTGLLFGVLSASDIGVIQTLDPGTAWGTRNLSLQPNGGNVGVGMTPVGYKLDVSGSVRATAFFYGSDRSLKKDIAPLNGSLKKILNLDGVSFTWKENGKKSVGLIAQDVEKVYPELVHTSDNGIKSVEYGNLVAPLIEAIKEQQKEIDLLRAEVDALKNK
jgi:hypothetical protein